MRFRLPHLRATSAPLRLAVAAGVGLTAVGAAAAVASPPPSAIQEDVDGRTWLALPRADSTTFVLVNGISGLYEAAITADGTGDELDFAGATREATLFTDASGATAIGNGRHDVTRISGAGAVALAGESIWTIGDDLTRRSLGDGEVTGRLPLPAPPVGDVAPVVDADARVWYLAGKGDDRSVVRFGSDGGDIETFDVDPSSEALLLLDGAAHVVTDTGVAAVEGGSELAAPSGNRVDPSVAHETGGLWATARGAELEVARAGEVGEQRVPAPVTDLAIWHGGLVVATADGALAGPPGDLQAIEGIGAAPRIHDDGGLLWLTTTDGAVALADDLTPTVFDLADADLSLCVDDCSAGAASRFLEEKAAVELEEQEQEQEAKRTEDEEEAPTPKETEVEVPKVADAPAPRPLDPAVTKPTLPTPTSTTLPDVGVTSKKAQKQAEKKKGDAEAPATPTTVPAILAAPLPSLSPPPAPAPDRSKGRGKDKHRDRDDDDDDREEAPAPAPTPAPAPAPSPALVPLPPVLMPTTTTTTTTTTPENDKGNGRDKDKGKDEDEATPPEDEEPPADGDPHEPPAEDPGGASLIYSVSPEKGGATASIGIAGKPAACGGVPAATATLSWSGSSSGSRTVAVSWSDLDDEQSSVASATIAAEPGSLTVTATACGMTASQTVTVPGKGKDDGEEPDPTTTTTAPPTTTTTPLPTTTTVPRTTTTTAPPTTTTTAPPTTTTTTQPPDPDPVVP